MTTECAIHVAYDDRTRARIREEADRLRWAARCGIPVPEVRDERPEWLITSRAVNDEVTSGRAYVESAVAAAQAIAGAPEPPPSVRGPAPAHGGGRKAGAQRLYRILRSPLSPAEFRSARAAAAGLPRDTLAHGDFVLHNILFDSSRARVTVIDWEFLNYAPAGFDLCVLWPRLPEAEDRERVLDAALAAVPDRAALAVLHHWLAVRYLADLVTRPSRRDWSRERIDNAVRRLAEARAHARTWKG
ncbi:MAG: phosphotransferase [Acidimicrobiia bacterium]